MLNSIGELSDCVLACAATFRLTAATQVDGLSPPSGLNSASALDECPRQYQYRTVARSVSRQKVPRPSASQVCDGRCKPAFWRIGRIARLLWVVRTTRCASLAYFWGPRLIWPWLDCRFAPASLQSEVLAGTTPQAAVTRSPPTARVMSCEPPQPNYSALQSAYASSSGAAFVFLAFCKLVPNAPQGLQTPTNSPDSSEQHRRDIGRGGCSLGSRGCQRMPGRLAADFLD
jgi:hypothetical protein